MDVAQETERNYSIQAQLGRHHTWLLLCFSPFPLRHPIHLKSENVADVINGRPQTYFLCNVATREDMRKRRALTDRSGSNIELSSLGEDRGHPGAAV